MLDTSESWAVLAPCDYFLKNLIFSLEESFYPAIRQILNVSRQHPLTGLAMRAGAK
jgi:hypothetical protein